MIALWSESAGRTGICLQCRAHASLMTAEHAVLHTQVMSQQTQLPRVMEYFNRWIAKWPTVKVITCGWMSYSLVNKAAWHAACKIHVQSWRPDCCVTEIMCDDASRERHSKILVKCPLLHCPGLVRGQLGGCELNVGGAGVLQASAIPAGRSAVCHAAPRWLIPMHLKGAAEDPR